MRPLELFAVLAVAFVVLALPELPRLSRLLVRRRVPGPHEAENRRIELVALRIVAWVGFVALLVFVAART